MPRKNFVRKISRTPFAQPCAAKHRYTSEKAAQNAADLSMLERSAVTLSVYHCPYCGGWHLTSASK